jgi:hypothetical protein
MIQYWYVKKIDVLFPSKTGFLISKKERYRVVDLLTLIIFSIEFRVCKWAEIPVKRVQSFEFYWADALPKPARKGGQAGGGAYPWERGEWRGVYLSHTTLFTLVICWIYKKTHRLVTLASFLKKTNKLHHTYPQHSLFYFSSRQSWVGCDLQ